MGVKDIIPLYLGDEIAPKMKFTKLEYLILNIKLFGLYFFIFFGGITLMSNYYMMKYSLLCFCPI